MLLASAATAAVLPCRWNLRATIGRVPGEPTSMPEEWCASGASLPFALDVDVLATPALVADDRVGDGACEIQPLFADVSITGFGGSAGAPVRGGGWSIDEQRRLNFWLEFPEGAARCGADDCEVWDLAPGVALQGADVALPKGRLYFETELTDNAELEQLEREYLAARSAAWQAKESVDQMELAMNPEPVWSADAGAWVKQSVKPGMIEERRVRAALGAAQKKQDEADKRRPERATLARDAGSWPGGSPARWLRRKGTLRVRRSGPFGELPFGLGHHFAVVGTFSAEPLAPVETFWTMPES